MSVFFRKSDRDHSISEICKTFPHFMLRGQWAIPSVTYRLNFDLPPIGFVRVASQCSRIPLLGEARDNSRGPSGWARTSSRLRMCPGQKKSERRFSYLFRWQLSSLVCMWLAWHRLLQKCMQFLSWRKSLFTLCWKLLASSMTLVFVRSSVISCETAAPVDKETRFHYLQRSDPAWVPTDPLCWWHLVHLWKFCSVLWPCERRDLAEDQGLYKYHICTQQWSNIVIQHLLLVPQQFMCLDSQFLLSSVLLEFFQFYIFLSL